MRKSIMSIGSVGSSIALASVLMLSSGAVHASPGKIIFEENCAACHGFDGVPFLPGAPDFSVGERLDKTDAELMKSMKEGLNMMPPWQPEGKDAVLNDQQLKDSLTYIKTFVAK